MTELLKNEKFEPLGYNGLEIIQNSELYRFTSDSVIFANYIDVNKGAKVLDLGCGSGIIGTIIASKTSADTVVGIDIQDCLIDMARRSAEHNGLADKLKIIKLDIVGAYEQLGTFDIVVTNPPYEKLNAGEGSASEHINICRREVLLTFDNIAETASRCLNSKGRFYMIHRANRLAECIITMAKNNLITKRVTLLIPKVGKVADTVIITAKKDAKQGMTMDTIIVNNDNDTITEQVINLIERKR